MQEPYNIMYLQIGISVTDVCELLDIALIPLSRIEDSPEKRQLAAILRTVSRNLRKSMGDAEETLLKHTDQE